MKFNFKRYAIWLVLLASTSGCEKVKNFFQNLIGSKSEPTKVETVVPSYKDIQIPNVIKINVGEGQGPEVQTNDKIAIFWDCWIYDPAAPLNKGKKIYGTDPKGEPQIVTVGKSEIVPGFDTGVIGMKKAGKRQLIVPSELAYGPDGSGNVPGGAIILFEVTLVDIIKP